MEINDIEDHEQEFKKLQASFKLLYDRFLAVAMDYKHFINSDIKDNEIFALRDNVLYRFYSARFHFDLLFEYHSKVENRLRELYRNKPAALFTDSFERSSIQMQSTREIYSLFDSMVYHLCSIYDYVFRLVNFIHGKVLLKNPKWNRFQDDKNLKEFKYCSKEIIPALQKIDENFVFPLIKHRSHLIHTQSDIGGFTLIFSLENEAFNTKFHATKLFKETFREIHSDKRINEFTIKYAALWLINKTIRTTTDVLFELRDDMIRNKKISHGMFVLLDPNNTMIPMSTPKWKDRSEV